METRVIPPLPVLTKEAGGISRGDEGLSLKKG
jgi:hypothetical protein